MTCYWNTLTLLNDIKNVKKWSSTIKHEHGILKQPSDLGKKKFSKHGIQECAMLVAKSVRNSTA